MHSNRYFISSMTTVAVIIPRITTDTDMITIGSTISGLEVLVLSMLSICCFFAVSEMSNKSAEVAFVLFKILAVSYILNWYSLAKVNGSFTTSFPIWYSLSWSVEFVVTVAMNSLPSCCIIISTSSSSLRLYLSL